MGTGTQSAKLMENWGSPTVCRGKPGTPDVSCSARALAEIAESAMSGYSRYPWGGVEIGGVLFGRRESDVVFIDSYRTAECEHHYGPAFELSERDCESFERLLASASADAALAGLIPVGWYQSISRRELGLSDQARTMFQRFFPDSGQMAMVVKRSKRDPLSVAFFMRDLRGGIELHSPALEFTIESLRQPPPLQEAPPVPEQKPVEPPLIPASVNEMEPPSVVGAQRLDPPSDALTEAPITEARHVLQPPPLELHDLGRTAAFSREEQPQFVVEEPPEPLAAAFTGESGTENQLQHALQPPPLPLPGPAWTPAFFSEEQRQSVVEEPRPEPPAAALTGVSAAESQSQHGLQPPPLELPNPAWTSALFNEERPQSVVQEPQPESAPVESTGVPAAESELQHAPQPPPLELHNPAWPPAFSSGEPVVKEPRPEPPGAVLTAASFSEEHPQNLLELPHLEQPLREALSESVAELTPQLSDPPLTEEPVDERRPQPVVELHPAAPGFQGAWPDTLEDPFRAAPDAGFFYPSAVHREALGTLLYQIRSRAGFLGLVGAPGTGKTIVLERLMELLTAEETEFAFLINPKITVPEFFELIAYDFELPGSSRTKAATLIALNEHLLRRSSAGRTTALIVDNAQKLSSEVLEEIELLGNLENREGRLLQVIFSAQPEFEQLLDVPELCGLRQRLLLFARLEPLDAKETAAYVEHRMSRAGWAHQGVFRNDVLVEVYRRTHGVPRLISALCGKLLQNCHDLQVRTVSAGMVERAADELGLDESHPWREAANL